MNLLPWAVILVVIAIWFFLLRTRATEIGSKNDFDAMINSGQPVVLDFFSNT